LRVRNTLAPGVLQEFGAFRHAVFEAMGELRASEEAITGPLTTKNTNSIFKHYSNDDLALIEACAKAYSVALKKKT
jgi:methionine synthase II (cobalamin-independent)